MTIVVDNKWRVELPVVTRYMGREYVDAFFETGALRLSSFSALRRHPDEAVRDTREGLPQVENRSGGSRGVFLGVMSQESYVLCGSMADLRSSNAGFCTESGIRIFDPYAFAREVSVEIPGFALGLIGPCEYRENIAAQTNEPFAFRPPSSPEDAERIGRALHEQSSRLALKGLFVKALRFAHEVEFRMIWLAGDGQREFIDVECPSARMYCEKVE